MNETTPGSAAWLAQLQEPIIDPQQRIIDPHHHLWDRANSRYLLEDLWADTETGHRIEKTVFVECRAGYRAEGPEHLRCVGETEFVREIAGASAADGDRARIAAIVARADLTQGDLLEEVLEAHETAGAGLFRGIRQSAARDPDPEGLSIRIRAPEGLYRRADFRQGLKRLGELGYSFDAWHYHHQNPDFAELARAVPETTLILNHFGTPLGVGRHAGQREAIFERWRKDISEIAACPNVVAKLGGLAMPDNGFGWDQAAGPASSDELVAAQRRYYLHTIDAFGPERCMFESNFPVDKRSISYPVLWNALKKIAAEFSPAEREAMFRGTAERIYGLAD